ncbi:glycosyltransferase involved in cell wall biosynthesis [Gillisia sp. Hel_I_86]|uniref:glycosyltransferase family 2 protein n=1 Tax=Gillisia sp. Hel_I_86 TaxID=1249981 RepID=UPI001199C237|nr:glycosyltransferase family 2 protein [Gillisia sp. Hel_I_86]TVZ25573.1 glycosyltransferase involved in cell wall biosynthesis [Gillisia sp. Hel_I_86]
MNPSPIVSIIMATYNREHLISETLVSIQNQTFPNWECLIIDDGSTDDTKEILRPFLDGESRFKYIKRSSKYKKGLPGCRNMGLDIAKGEYVVFFDDDDIVHPENLKISVDNFKNNVKYVRYLRKVFWGDFHYNFDGNTKYNSELLDISVLDKMITNKIPFNSCQVMWRRECFIMNRFNEALMYAEEWECYSRILSSGIKGISVNKVLFYGRKHSNSNTGEFHSGNNIRRDSQIKASFLIMEKLKKNNLWNEVLEKFFIRLGFSIQSFSVTKTALAAGNSSNWKSFKYKFGYQFYFVLKPIFELKSKMIKS